MPYKQTIRGPVLYVSWRGFTLDDLRSVAAEITKLCERRGEGVVYLSRVPADTRPFTAGERAVLQQFLLTILPSCASVHHVIEGDGFVKSARRSIVTNMALATPRPRDFHTYASMDEARTAIADAYRVDLSGLGVPAASRVPPASATRVKSVPPTARASTALRAAVRIAGDRKPSVRRGS